MILKKNAYGKINLYLDVLDKMENGYHNIESIMQSVSLCDQITLENIVGKAVIRGTKVTASLEKDAVVCFKVK